jgi:predicted nucleic acid-binding protein
MRQYLLDTNVLGAYLQGRQGALSLAKMRIHNDEAATSIVVYGEITEYLKGFAEFRKYQAALRTLLRKVYPYPLTLQCLSSMQTSGVRCVHLMGRDLLEILIP